MEQIHSSSKAASELLIDSYYKSFFIDTKNAAASARAGNVIGGGDWSNYRLFPDIIRSCFENKPLEIRNPESVRPWQHVLDPIFGYLSLAVKLSNTEKLNIVMDGILDLRIMLTLQLKKLLK